MRIFYGVQGTGNGHITRARVMAKTLAQAGIQVDYQFTGRPAEHYFDMEIFADYQVRAGLTFVTHKGQVNYAKTALKAKPLQFFKDISSLDLRDYDLVISDFEPVTAWAARRQNKSLLGIGHQYAFAHQIPRSGGDPIAELVMRNFAPASQSVGLHWHHFGQPILPPIIETPEQPKSCFKHKIVVYLPFEDTAEVCQLLAPFTDFEFYLYSPNPIVSGFEHIECKALSRNGFQQDLYDCAGIISNAGFELASEALQLGKKILVKPLHAQMEQLSNATALAQLGYGHVMHDLDRGTVGHWLADNHAIRVTYPCVAKILTDWIIAGMPTMDRNFIEKVWNEVDVLKIQH